MCVTGSILAPRPVDDSPPRTRDVVVNDTRNYRRPVENICFAAKRTSPPSRDNRTPALKTNDYRRQTIFLTDLIADVERHANSSTRFLRLINSRFELRGLAFPKTRIVFTYSTYGISRLSAIPPVSSTAKH